MWVAQGVLLCISHLTTLVLFRISQHPRTPNSEREGTTLNHIGVVVLTTSAATVGRVVKKQLHGIHFFASSDFASSDLDPTAPGGYWRPAVGLGNVQWSYLGRSFLLGVLVQTPNTWERALLEISFLGGRVAVLAVVAVAVAAVR